MEHDKLTQLTLPLKSKQFGDKFMMWNDADEEYPYEWEVYDFDKNFNKGVDALIDYIDAHDRYRDGDCDGKEVFNKNIAFINVDGETLLDYAFRSKGLLSQ